MATEDAVAVSFAFQDLVDKLDGTVDDTQLASATDALAAAQHLFGQAELALSYSDPDSIEELMLLPASLGPDIVASFASLKSGLDQYASQPLNPLILPPTVSGGQELARSLQIEAGALAANLQILADAWSPDKPENFRNLYFSTSGDEASARIIRGMLALNEALLRDAIIPEQTRSRLQGLVNVWEGSYQNGKTQIASGAGYRILLDQIDPEFSQEVSDTLSKSLQTANDLAADSDAEKQALSLIMEEIHAHILRASQDLGYSPEPK